MRSALEWVDYLTETLYKYVYLQDMILRIFIEKQKTKEKIKMVVKYVMMCMGNGYRRIWKDNF